MKKSILVLLSLILFCGGTFADDFDFGAGAKKTMKKIKGYPRYQQTKDYTCGPSVLLAIANFYNGDCEYPLTSEMEVQIEMEAGTVPWTAPNQPAGTNPQQMVDWLTSKGFNPTLEFEDIGDESGLIKIRQKVEAGIPCIVAWTDWGGHWATVIGYDDKGTESVMDDVILFADPYDRVDGNQNSRTKFSAYRFYWMWFEAMCFDPTGPPTWRTLITLE